MERLEAMETCSLPVMTRVSFRYVVGSFAESNLSFRLSPLFGIDTELDRFLFFQVFNLNSREILKQIKDHQQSATLSRSCFSSLLPRS